MKKVAIALALLLLLGPFVGLLAIGPLGRLFPHAPETRV